jgi:hypothetical protein
MIGSGYGLDAHIKELDWSGGFLDASAGAPT